MMIQSLKTKVKYNRKLLYWIVIIYYYFILVDGASVCDVESDMVEAGDCGLVAKEGERIVGSPIDINDDPIAQNEGKI